MSEVHDGYLIFTTYILEKELPEVMRKRLAIVLLLFTIAAHAMAEQREPANHVPGRGSEEVGMNFQLRDAQGKLHFVDSLTGKQGTVLLFISTQCQISHAYTKRMNSLHEDYKSRGITIIGVVSNINEPVETIENFAQRNLRFTVYKDVNCQASRSLGAQVTPEAVFINNHNQVVYRGRIDNARDPLQVTSNDLRDAIEASLEGKSLSTREVRAFGCVIKCSM